ncbi:MGMT family protein [Patescibacteria group bacterium]|nr:MAG: MGMT family protein [Patescibacteria group bacterium]
MTPFAQAVYDVVRRIPKGQTMTYKDVAVAAGRPRAYRGVGNILNKNYDPSIPCHRVIRSDGTTGGYSLLKTKLPISVTLIPWFESRSQRKRKIF